MGFFDWFTNRDDFERGTLHEMMPKYEFKLPKLRTVKGNLTKNIEGKWSGTAFQNNYNYNEKSHLPYKSNVDYITKFLQIAEVDYNSEIIEHLRRISFFDNKIFKFRRELVNKKRNVEIAGERDGAFKFFMVEFSKEIFIKKYCWYFEKNHKVLANLIKEGKEQQEVTNQLVMGLEETVDDVFLKKEGDFYILKDGYDLEFEGFKRPPEPAFAPDDSEGNILQKVLENEIECAIQQVSNDKLLMHTSRHVEIEIDFAGFISETIKTVIPMNTTELFRVHEKATTQINVKGDYVDDRDTIVKDSVISRSNVGSGGKSKAEKLREVKALLDDGIIDDDDYEKMKREIIG